MGKKVIKTKKKMMSKIDAIKILFADLILNSTTAIEYKLQHEDDLQYILKFSFERVEDKEGKVMSKSDLIAINKEEK